MRAVLVDRVTNGQAATSVTEACSTAALLVVIAAARAWAAAVS